MDAGWSTTTGTVPCLACRLVNASRSLGSLSGSSRASIVLLPAGVMAVAWCISRSRRAPGCYFRRLGTVPGRVFRHLCRSRIIQKSIKKAA